MSAVLPLDFIARSGFEGPQIVLTWSGLNEADMDLFLILRKKISPSLDSTDGKTVLSETSPPFSLSFVDKDLEDGVVYYYTMFVRDTATGDVLTGANVQVSALALETQFFRKFLFELLPPLYRLADKGIL